MTSNARRSPRHRSPKLDWLASLAVALFTLALQLPTVPAEALQGDPGEFQLAAVIGGLAHPTGYPLYLLIGWAWTKLSLFGSPAYSLNLLSAIFGAAAAGLTTRLVLALVGTGPTWLALGAAGWAGFSMALAPTYWSQSIVAEVYTLHCLLWAALALATLRWGGQPSRWWMIGLLAGLGLAHHRMTVLYLPAVAAYLWLQRPGRDGPRHLLWALVALLLPLALYAYIPLRAPHTPYLNLALGPGDTLVLYDSTLAGFLRFVSGQAFEGALTAAGLAERARAAVGWASAEMAPGLLVVAGAIWLARARWKAAVLLVGALAANTAFNLIYAIGDIHVFYLPVYQTAAVLAGVAIAGWGAGSSLRSGAAGLVLLALLVSVGIRLPGARQEALSSIPNAPQGYWDAALAAAPSDAILISNDRNEIVPMWYEQYAEGRRPDLLGLFPLISPEPEYAHIGALATRALSTGRPVCLTKEMPGMEVGFRLAPAESSPRCLEGLWEEPERGMELWLSPELLLLGVDAPGHALRPGSDFLVTLHWQAQSPLSAPYSTYVHVLDADGSPAWNGSDHRPGGDYLPANLWLPGQVIRDHHELKVPEGALPGTYRLLVGMYEYPSLQSYGQSLIAGEFAVTSANP